MQRFITKQVSVGGVKIGGGAKISTQSMTFSKTKDIEQTLQQINRLYFAGADIVRCAVLDEIDAKALKTIKEQSPLPIVADIHFNYKHALRVSDFVDAIRINPGNIGSSDRIKAVVDACGKRDIPIRIGINSGSIDQKFLDRYSNNVDAMLACAMHNIKLLEKNSFYNIVISMKCSNVVDTINAYTRLRGMCEYPFHLGVTEAGTKFHASIKSAIAIGNLLLNGIGDTIRISITGELEEEIKVAKAILNDTGVQKEGLNIISCPTCGRIQSDLVSAVKLIQEKTSHIKIPLNVSVMGCVVNALGEAKEADVAIAFGKNNGLIIKKGEIVAKLKEEELVDRFLKELEIECEKFKG